MRNNIIEKLKTKFSQKEYQESDVVYILVEIYKFLEQLEETERKKFKFILFYRDWICHHSLDRNSNLSVFFKIVIEDIRKNGIDPDRISDNLPVAIKSFSLNRLKEDLESFSKGFLDNEKLNWLNFKRHLYRVLIDQKLKIPVSRYLTFSYKEIAVGIIDKTLDLSDDIEVSLEIEKLEISGSYNDPFIENQT